MIQERKNAPDKMQRVEVMWVVIKILKNKLKKRIIKLDPTLVQIGIKKIKR